MAIKLFTMVSMLLVTQVVLADNSIKPDKKLCQKVQSKISLIHSKMKQPYTVRQGEKLKRKLRQLKKVRYQCRKHRILQK